MSKNILILLMIGLILALVCPNVSGQTWNLTWSDEFNGTGAPDPTKWDRPEYIRHDNGTGPDGWWDHDDSYLEGGNLVIRVRRVPNGNADSDPYDYSVGAVRTKDKFMPTYGKFEIRAQMPVMQGWWVAFWMMQGDVCQLGNGGVDGSEVDIFEGWGWTDKISHAVHWDCYGAEHRQVDRSEYIPGIRSGWHTFTLVWNPSIYIFYVDGIERWSTPAGGVCNQPGYIKLTGEISTKPAAITDNWARNPEGVPYPDYYRVDYVRVYSASPGVVFHQNTDYGGASSQSIQPGTYTMAQLAGMGVPNDWASSVQIPNGWTVTMYEHDNSSGQSWTLTGDTPNFLTLSPGANDKLSACRITDEAINLAELQVYDTLINTSARLKAKDRASSNNNQSTVQVSPNPAISVLRVSGAAAGSNFSIVNSDGQTVLNTTQKNINIEKLAKGVYFLQITSGSNNQTIKFVKQ